MIRTTVAALAAAAFALLMAPSAVTAAPPPDAVRILETNIGSGDNQACPPASQDDCSGTLEQQIADFGPDVVAGEEFCQADVDELEERHPTWVVYFEPMVEAGQLDGCDLGAKGQVIAGPSLADREVFDLPGDFTDAGITRNYKMLCARTTSDHRRHCVVHLRHGADYADVRARQVNAILAHAEGWQRHTISGDFNLRSDDAAFKKLTNAGYVDIVTGRVTHVLAKGAIADTGGWSVPQPTSDHPMTRAWVDWAS